MWSCDWYGFKWDKEEREETEKQSTKGKNYITLWIVRMWENE